MSQSDSKMIFVAALVSALLSSALSATVASRVAAQAARQEVLALQAAQEAEAWGRFAEMLKLAVPAPDPAARSRKVEAARAKERAGEWFEALKYLDEADLLGALSPDEAKLKAAWLAKLPEAEARRFDRHHRLRRAKSQAEMSAIHAEPD